MRSDITAGDAAEWRGDAECLGTDPDLFFPLGDTGEPRARAAAAKRICGLCRVRSQCLQFALESNQATGVWGGTTEEERRSVRREWLRAGRPSRIAVP